jgi:hypothetical protein
MSMFCTVSSRGLGGRNQGLEETYSLHIQPRMKITTAFGDNAQSSLVEVDRRFRRAYCLLWNVG